MFLEKTMIELRLETMPTFSLAGLSEVQQKEEWARVLWVKMSDVVMVANQYQKKDWTAETLGKVFEPLNRSCFWYYVEGAEKPSYAGFCAVSLFIFSGSGGRVGKVPFTEDKLLVTNEWAMKVLKLVKLGVTEMKLDANDVAYGMCNGLHMEKISTLLKRKPEGTKPKAKVNQK
jgi:hypothetical protein